MRILLVEDHLDSLEAMQRIIARQGHNVATATTLQDAVRQCLDGTFDLVICDIGLPDGEGWGLAAVARRCGCPAIAVTGYGMPDEVARARSAGFVDHLLKPISQDLLLSAIARATQSDGPASGVAPA
jgi:CheY-like chemotaxis protein